MNPIKSIPVLLCIIISTCAWGWLNLVYRPLQYDVVTCQEFNWAFFDSTPIRQLGYPLVFAESHLECVSFDEGGYTPYAIKPAALAVDVTIWIASTAVLVMCVIGVRRSYHSNGWTKTTSPKMVALVGLMGVALTLSAALVPRQSLNDGMRCYDSAIAPALPYQHGYPLVFYEQSVPACSSYRWVETPNVCNGNCTDYYADPSHFYWQPLAINLSVGIAIATLGYTGIRWHRSKR